MTAAIKLEAPQRSQAAATAWRRGNEVTAAGLGLETIAELLVDGLPDSDANGLHHAILALAAFIKSAGYELAEKAEREGYGDE